MPGPVFLAARWPQTAFKPEIAGNPFLALPEENFAACGGPTFATVECFSPIDESSHSGEKRQMDHLSEGIDVRGATSAHALG